MQNIEIKYRISSPVEFRTQLDSQTQVEFRFCHRQRDIYFNAPGRRLKMRLEDGRKPCLIEYTRPDTDQPRISDYSLTFVDNPSREIARLQKDYGILSEVNKQRTLYMYKNVRIHLDEVEDLGWFVEFESVVSEEYPAVQAQKHLDEILSTLSQYLGSAQSVSYIDLLLSASSTDHSA